MRFAFVVIAFFIHVAIRAQLTAPGANAVRYTSYSSSPSVHDPVFIYCDPDGTRSGTLTAESPGGAGPFTFAWYRWNDQTNSFSDHITTQTGVSSSTISSLSEGGYRVIISGGVSATLTGWIHLDQPHALAQLQNRTCDYVALKGTAVADTFYYHDPSFGIPLKLPNAVRFLWSSEPQSVIPYPDFAINPQTFTPPLDDVTYNLQVTDSFGCVSESSFFYESIHVKAEFTAEPVKGEAPLEVVITDESVRGNYRYRWDFDERTPDGNSSPDWVVSEDSLWLFEDPFTHKYFIPGRYSISLVVESNMHCIDSFRLEQEIEVEPSDLDIPNVFSPDGDGVNDYFKVASKSLKWIKIDVFSRSGLRVYRFYGEGDRLAMWQGWDGNVNDTSIKASPGVYFYVIRARGWDNVEYDTRSQRGFVYLYR